MGKGGIQRLGDRGAIRLTPSIMREMKRRAAVEPVIGHIRNEHGMGRSYLAGTQGDAISAILAAAGYVFRLLLTWLRMILRRLVIMFLGVINNLKSVLGIRDCRRVAIRVRS